MRKKMKTSIAIMAHEERKEWIPGMIGILGDVPVLMDRGRPGDAENLGLWANCRRSWLAFDPEAEWHFVLQDDSILPRDFHKRLDRILDRIGAQDFVISLYAGERYRARVMTALNAGRPYVIGNEILNENALGMRTKHIAQMVAYCDSRGADSDRYIQTYARKKGLPIYAPLPSIVNHRVAPSLYRRLYEKAYPDSVRQAVWFAGENPPVNRGIIGP
jgi:hypothetical protein